jgi:hypothetical protein
MLHAKDVTLRSFEFNLCLGKSNFSGSEAFSRLRKGNAVVLRFPPLALARSRKIVKIELGDVQRRCQTFRHST